MMLRIKYVILLVFLAISSTYSQSNGDLEKAETLLRDGNYNQLIQFVDEIGKTPPSEFALQCKKAEALIRIGQFVKATALLIELQELSKGNPFNEAIVQTKFATLYLSQSRFDLAVEKLQTALNEFNQEKKTNTLEAAEAIALLGNVYRSTGKLTLADEQLQMALSIRLKILPETHELIAASYNDLGLVYTQIDADKAYDYYEKALSIYEKIHGSEHPKIAIANTNLGVLNRSEKLYGDAITHFEAALKIWNKIYPEPHPNKALVLMNLGQTYSSMGNQKPALEFYEKALTMYETSEGRKHPDVAYVYNLLGNEKVAQKKFDEALKDYQKALIANTPTFNSETISTNPYIKEYYNGNQLLYSLMYKAQALESKYYGKDLKDDNLHLAVSTLQLADTLIDQLRQQSSNESDKITLGVIANDIYADGVRIAYTLSQVSLRNRKYFREISFYFAEKSKSAVLLEAISETDAKEFANIPKELIDEEKNLKSSISLISQKLAQKPSDEEEKHLREDLFKLNRTYEAFIKRLENLYPEYFNLKYNPVSPTITQIQNILPKSTAVLTYFIDEKNSRLYTYSITKNSFKITDRLLPKDYNREITLLRNSLYYIDLHAFTEASKFLSKLLIPKFRSTIHDLVIIPTGRMSVIPFETLLSKNVRKEEDFKDLPYLLKKYSIRYEFSAGLVLQKKQKSANTSISSAMLCAPISFPENENLFDLPGTESEVNAIAKLFSQNNISSKILLHKDANETSLKSGSLKDYSIVHFATHGIVDENNPELSRIFLQTNSDKEDGNLFAGEIYNLQLNADLVALSACQTGLGKISKGEGVIGLSRALVYAGAKNIIVSFWSVADESTSELMTGFYKQMLKSNSRNFSENLRRAKLDLLNGNFPAPYYWAPFILIGF